MIMHQRYLETLHRLGKGVAVALLVCTGTQANALTLAHWDFETDLIAGGTPASGDVVSHPSVIGTHDAALADVSGNGNALSAFTEDFIDVEAEIDESFGQMDFSDVVSGSNRTGSTRSVIKGADKCCPGLFTDGDLDVGGTAVGALAAWTIEASVNFRTIGGFQTIVGKDGFETTTNDTARAPLYFQKQSNNLFAIKYVDVAGNVYDLEGTTVAAIDTWYNVAATNDGSTLKLFVNGVEEATLDVSASTDSAMIALDEAGLSGDAPYVWTVARGMYNNGHGDRLDGYVDDVRISDVALSTSEFLNDTIDSLALVVNTIDGTVKIRNVSGEAISFDYYRVDSETDGSLLTGYNSLSDQGIDAVNGGDDPGETWEEVTASNSANLLVEQFLQGSTTLADGQSVSLGTAFDFSIAGSGVDGDLTFQFATVGGALMTASVEYTTSDGLDGDFNDDGTVDAADYTVWRDNLGNDASALNGNGTGSGTVVAADYDLWVLNYGTSESTSSATAVPEPTTLLLAFLGMAAATATRRR